MFTKCKVETVDGKDVVKRIHKVIVHSFFMGDVEDPDLYAAEPMYQWENSPTGKWVKDNAEVTPEWRRNMDMALYGYRYVIIAELEEKKLTEFYLRFGPLKK